MFKIFYPFFAAVILLSGCAHVVSPEIKEESDPELTFTELQLNPQAHRGKIIALGGVIVEATNKDEGTLLEIYQTRTDHRGIPIDLDVSKGRYLIFYRELLDPEIFRKGRKVTIAARVEGERMGRVGEVDYMYPFLTALEIHLWEERPRYEPYPWGYQDPWHPGFSPYHRSPFHRHHPWW